MNAGETIRNLRQGAGLTLQDVASQMGWSVGWQSQLETGKAPLSPVEFHRLAIVIDELKRANDAEYERKQRELAGVGD